MNRKTFYVSMGLGLAASAAAAIAMHPRKKHKMKSAVGKAFKTMGEVADSISDTMGW